MVEFDSLIEVFNDLTKAPDKFLSSCLLTEELKVLLKNIYDFSQKYERTSKKALPELIIKDFDDEQIWQELELQNEDNLPSFINKATRLLVSKNLVFPVKAVSNVSEEDNKRLNKKKVSKKKKSVKKSDALSSEDESDEDNEILSENDGFGLEKEKKKRVKIVPSQVDDDFFKLSEMEAFLKDQEEKNDGLGEGIDLFGTFESDDSENENRPKYNDFFNEEEENKSFEHDDEGIGDSYGDENENETDENNEFDEGESKEKSKKVKFDLKSDSELSSDDESRIKSSFELREERLRKKINELEEKALEEKAWPLKGEVNAAMRPINSLLEEVVEFDTAQRPSPIITEETTNRLEDIIKQRILDQAYDDVERKLKPVSTPYEFKKKLVLDQEKSKLSLAEVYEQEYLKQKVEQNAENTPEVEPEEHQIIKKMMKSLFARLDALSNFFFVPKPIAPDLKIVSNAPAIEMEEVAQVSVSDAKLLAPEEVAGDFKKTLLTSEEKTKTDRKRQRRKKKALQAERFKVKARNDKPASYNDQLNKVMKFKNVTKLDEKPTNTSKSSKDFFSKLQDEVQNQSPQKNSIKKRKSNQIHKTAKKLKL